jgi:TolA-binding protein
MHCNKIAALYPASSQLANSKLLLAKIYADDLKQYNTAINIYQSVADKFPNSEWAAKSLQSMADIAQRQKQYMLALEVYDRIIKTYPADEFAYEAMTAKAKIYRKELDRPKKAINVYKQINTDFKGDKGVDALMQAAEIAGSDLKDYNMQVSTYGVIAGSYPNHSNTPNVIYKMAYLYERQLDNPEKAIALYKKVISRYKGNSAAVQAQKRLDKLLGRIDN